LDEGSPLPVAVPAGDFGALLSSLFLSLQATVSAEASRMVAKVFMSGAPGGYAVG
jgi:hypothetical protein